ncbi:histidine phosphatase family protein [Actinocatenispora rupis]|uniref:Putative phosphoglycerate mutase GpmB n=1 Tax=Actinocatenispora rupis TaxID=519421 RepID=A0A8J3J791_9ACTN|nr:histidine phosphatase family protein [Actinocatenispora rupis]GID13292.1 putative phosphoglycerate mutase GpmB [Actinocatenispora rupis]
MTTVVLARHGRTGWHSPNRYTGSSDIDIDDVGTGQAARLAEWASTAGITSLACTDLRRTRQTVRPVAAAVGLTPTVEPRLRELHFGIAEGHTLDELRASHPDAVDAFLRDPVTHHFPDGEHPADAVRRARAGLADLVAADPDGTILAVAHSTLIRLLVTDVMGAPLSRYRALLPDLVPTSLTTFLVRPGNIALAAFNVPPVPYRPEP